MISSKSQGQISVEGRLIPRQLHQVLLKVFTSHFFCDAFHSENQFCVVKNSNSPLEDIPRADSKLQIYSCMIFCGVYILAMDILPKKNCRKSLSIIIKYHDHKELGLLLYRNGSEYFNCLLQSA